MGPFWRQILQGRKTQTCRKPRKRPIRQGDRLFLYWKCRVPKDRKAIHFIGKAVCLKVERKKYGEFAFDDEFARRDGFRDFAEMQEWFGDPLEHAHEEYDVILFSLLGGSATVTSCQVESEERVCSPQDDETRTATKPNMTTNRLGTPVNSDVQEDGSREPAQKKGGGIRNDEPPNST